MYKAVVENVTPLCRKCENSQGADVDLRHNASDADAAHLEGAVAAQPH
jgi:hypothetical protein